jgi:hypothetical protein
MSDVPIDQRVAALEIKVEMLERQMAEIMAAIATAGKPPVTTEQSNG